MTLPEIDEKYNKNISALKSLEQILKAQEASYEVHITRLTWLKQLADAAGELKRYEIEAIRSQQIAAQVAQQAQAREEAARAVQMQAQTPAPPTPTQVVTPVQTTATVASPAEIETSKKTRKKLE